MKPATVLLWHKAVVLSKLGDGVQSVTSASAGAHPVFDAQMDARLRGHDGLLLHPLQRCIELHNMSDAFDRPQEIS